MLQLEAYYLRFLSWGFLLVHLWTFALLCKSRISEAFDVVQYEHNVYVFFLVREPNILLLTSPRAFLVWSVIPSSNHNLLSHVLCSLSSSHCNHKQNYDSADLFHHRTEPKFLATTTQQHQATTTRIFFVPNDKGEYARMRRDEQCIVTTFVPGNGSVLYACQSIVLI